MKKYFLILFIALIFSFIKITNTVFAHNEIKEHWAKEELSIYLAEGYINTYTDGSIKPDNAITRYEFSQMINKIFGYYKKAKINYTDIPIDSDMYENLLITKEADYISKYDIDGSFRPNKLISREEAGVVLAKILKLQKIDKLENQFSDDYKISFYAKPYINSLILKGYMNGYSDNSFRPKSKLTRAEAVVLLDNIVGDIVKKQLNNKIINRNLTINGENLKFSNLQIKGDLIVAVGVKESNIEFENVEILGRTLILGGGENSIVFSNSHLDNMVIYKENGKIRVALEGNSDIKNTFVESGAFLKSNLEEGGFENVEIINIKKGESLILDGEFKEISVEATADIKINGDTKVNKMNLLKAADGTNLKVEESGNIQNLNILASSKISSNGEIYNLGVNIKDNNNGLILNGKMHIVDIIHSDGVIKILKNSNIDELDVEQTADGIQLEIEKGTIIKRLNAAGKINYIGEKYILNKTLDENKEIIEREIEENIYQENDEDEIKNNYSEVLVKEKNYVEKVSNIHFINVNGLSKLWFDMPKNNLGIKGYQILFSSDNGQTWLVDKYIGVNKNSFISMNDIAQNINREINFNKICIISKAYENNNMLDNSLIETIDYKIEYQNTPFINNVVKNENNIYIGISKISVDDIFMVEIDKKEGGIEQSILLGKDISGDHISINLENIILTNATIKVKKITAMQNKIVVNVNEINQIKTLIKEAKLEGENIVSKKLYVNVIPKNAEVTYRWYRSNAEFGEYEKIEDADKSEYILTIDDLFKYIKVTVTGIQNFDGFIVSNNSGKVLANVDKSLLKIKIDLEFVDKENRGEYLLKANDYTEDSYLNYKNSIDNAIQIENKLDAIQSQIEESINAIESAKSELVFNKRLELDNLMEEVNLYNKTNYTQESWQLLKDAMLLSENTNDELIYKIDNINNAVSKLILDVSELLDAIDRANIIKENIFESEDGKDILKKDKWVTNEVMVLLNSKIEFANQVIENAKTAQEIKDTTNLLNGSIDEFSNNIKNGEKVDIRTVELISFLEDENLRVGNRLKLKVIMDDDSYGEDRVEYSAIVKNAIDSEDVEGIIPINKTQCEFNVPLNYNKNGIEQSIVNKYIGFRVNLCGDSENYIEKIIGPVVEEYKILVTEINITAKWGSTSITQNNGTLLLMVNVLPNDAANKGINWSVQILEGEGEVATIDESGNLTAVGNGKVKVRAEAKDGSGVFAEYEVLISGQMD